MSYSNGPKIVTDGLVLCLDAANRKSYPLSGSTIYDLSGNGNNGTFGASAASPTFSGDNGGVLNFDGGDYFSGNLDYNLTTYPDFTVEAWVYGNSWTYANAYRGVLNRSNNVTHDFSVFISSSLNTTNSTGQMASWIFNTSNNIVQHNSSSSLILQTGVWNHCVWSFNDNVGFTYYLNDSNGVTHNTSTTRRKTATTSPYNVGRWVGGGYFWDGKISTVKFYNRALSSDEIRRNYNALKGRYGLT